MPVSMALVADLYPPAEAGASARHHRRGRHGGLGAGTSLRRDHGAVHELAVPVLDQSPCGLRDLLHHVVGIDRPATDGREGRHRLDRRDASWRRADSAQRRPWRAGSRARRINRSSVATSSVLGRRGRGGVRGLPGFSAARARSDPRLAHLLEPQSVGGERRQSAGRLLHHGGAGQRARSSSTLRARRTR